MRSEKIKITGEFIQLCDLLKLSGPRVSGGVAKQLILDGQVFVDHQVEFRKKCKIRPGQQVRVLDYTILVQ